MKCPHCEQEISGEACPRCGEATGYAGAAYCMACGAPLKGGQKAAPLRDEELEDENGFDLDDRVLCPDGTCTGIVIEGRCIECGRAVGPDGEFIQTDTTGGAQAASD